MEIRDEMPYVAKMANNLMRKRSHGVVGMRMFVQRNSNVSFDDIARDFCEMEYERFLTPCRKELSF